eukprot:3277032-Rhodomonas_salina.1
MYYYYMLAILGIRPWWKVRPALPSHLGLEANVDGLTLGGGWGGAEAPDQVPDRAVQQRRLLHRRILHPLLPEPHPRRDSLLLLPLLSQGAAPACCTVPCLGDEGKLTERDRTAEGGQRLPRRPRGCDLHRISQRVLPPALLPVLRQHLQTPAPLLLLLHAPRRACQARLAGAS